MSKKKVMMIFSVLFISCFVVSTLAYSQDKSGAKEKQQDESEAPDDSYLAKFKAIDYVEKNMDPTLKSIYMLKVIVSNFSDKNWNGEYEDIYNGYKQAIRSWYKRDVVSARVGLKKNNDDIKELMKKIIVEYQKSATTILDECAETVLKLHLDATSRTDPNRFEILFLNQLRLKVAYAKYDDSSQDTFKHYYKSAIYNLRVAKKYGIKILEDLAAPDQRKSVSDKYRKDKADNLNRILGSSKAKSGS